MSNENNLPGQKIKVQEESPERFTGLHLIHPKNAAAGLPAIFASARHILSEMGPFRAIHALNLLNQKMVTIALVAHGPIRMMKDRNSESIVRMV